MNTSVGNSTPWDELRQRVAANDITAVEQFLQDLEPADLVRTLFRLSADEQRALLMLVPPESAADLIEEMPESHAAELIDELPAGAAASIVEELDSDEQADVLGEMDTEDAEAILAEMGEDDAADARRLIEYSSDVAGGLMMTELIRYPPTARVRQVIADLREREAEYAQYNVQYIHVVRGRRRLVGIVRLRDMVFGDPDARLGDILQPALRVDPDASLEQLEDFFYEHDLSSIPVTGPRSELLGVVRRRAVFEALAERAEAANLKIQGIVGGEELRSMPLRVRAGRRLSWLTVNIGLNIVAASVIALYQDTLAAVIALAVFLPIVSDMSGCSGNQAVGVSLRELTLGVASPQDVIRVWLREVSVGLVNGLVLGSLIAVAAWAWQGNAVLGLVIGSALAINTVVAVSIGGTVPLVLKRFNVDPAVASGPVLTTITDMCGFFLVLSLATLALPALTG